MTLQIGETFEVTEKVDMTDGDTVIARYLPGTGYRVTPANLAFVEDLEAQGLARPFATRAAGQAASAVVRGQARVV